MTAEEWALAASVFFAGIAAGFLGGLCTILRPVQAAMDGREFRNFLETFLRFASNGLGKAFNYAWSGHPGTSAAERLRDTVEDVTAPGQPLRAKAGELGPHSNGPCLAQPPAATVQRWSPRRTPGS